MIITNPKQQLDLKIKLYHQTDQNPDHFFYLPITAESSTRSNTYYFSGSNRRFNNSYRNNSVRTKTQQEHEQKLNTFQSNQTNSTLFKETKNPFQLVPQKLIKHPFNRLHKNFSVVKYLYENQEELTLLIQELEFDQLLTNLIPILEQCIITQEIKGFLKMIKFLGDFAIYAQKLDQAIFLYQQGLIISEFTRFYLYKIKFLIRLSEAAKLLKRYDDCLKYLKKALLYSWKIKEINKEVLIYDYIGHIHFYRGELQLAQIYHKKFNQCQLEPENSYFRILSQKYIGFYEQTLPFFTNKFNKNLMTKLSLPIKNIFEEDDEKCDSLKYQNIKNCSGIKILDTISHSYEFIQLDFEFFLQDQKQNKKNVQRFKYKNSMLFISEDFKERKTRIMSEQCNSPKGEEKWEFKVVEKRIKQRVASLYKPYGEIQGQIFMTHLQTQRQKGSLEKKRKVRKSLQSLNKFAFYIINNPTK